jgi:hypothetical protein
MAKMGRGGKKAEKAASGPRGAKVPETGKAPGRPMEHKRPEKKS